MCRDDRLLPAVLTTGCLLLFAGWLLGAPRSQGGVGIPGLKGSRHRRSTPRAMPRQRRVPFKCAQRGCRPWEKPGRRGRGRRLAPWAAGADCRPCSLRPQPCKSDACIPSRGGGMQDEPPRRCASPWLTAPQSTVRRGPGCAAPNRSRRAAARACPSWQAGHPPRQRRLPAAQTYALLSNLSITNLNGFPSF